MRLKSNKFNDLVTETYRILQESQKTREGAEEDLKKIVQARSDYNAEKDTGMDSPPNFGIQRLR